MCLSLLTKTPLLTGNLHHTHTPSFQISIKRKKPQDFLMKATNQMIPAYL